MSKLQAPKRLRNEDFDEEYQDLISKIAYAMNVFNEDVYRAFSGNVSMENLNQEVISVNIQTGDNYEVDGQLKNPPRIALNIASKPEGIICIKADNKTNPQTFAINQPFVSYTLIDSKTVSILNVSGLRNSSEFILKLLIVGN